MNICYIWTIYIWTIYISTGSSRTHPASLMENCFLFTYPSYFNHWLFTHKSFPSWTVSTVVLFNILVITLCTQLKAKIPRAILGVSNNENKVKNCFDGQFCERKYVNKHWFSIRLSLISFTGILKFSFNSKFVFWMISYYITWCNCLNNTVHHTYFIDGGKNWGGDTAQYCKKQGRLTAGLVSLAQWVIILPLCGFILQAETCKILSLAENPRRSRVWQHVIN